MQNLLDKIKAFFSPKGKEGSFFERNFRIIAAAVVLVILVAVLVYAAALNTDKLQHSGKAVAGETSVDNFEFDNKFVEDKKVNEKIEALMKKYFDAYADGDIKALSKVATPISEKEKSYIKAVADYYDSHEDIKVYAKNGLTEGSYFVSVTYNVKFKDIDTKAPSLDFFYIDTDKDGKLYINNLYSAFNFSRNENDMDKTVYNVITKYEKQSDVVELQKDVQEKYEKALAKDKDLASTVTTKIPDTIKEWADSIKEDSEEDSKDSEDKKKTSDSDKKDTDKKDTEKKDSEKKDTDKKDSKKKNTEKKESKKSTEKKDTEKTTEKKDSNTVTVKGTDILVRDKASTDSNLIGSVSQGEKYKKLGQDGDWIWIDFNGQNGYVKKDFLQ